VTPETGNPTKLTRRAKAQRAQNKKRNQNHRWARIDPDFKKRKAESGKRKAEIQKLKTENLKPELSCCFLRLLAANFPLSAFAFRFGFSVSCSRHG
jgi:hypothetical protein